MWLYRNKILQTSITLVICTYLFSCAPSIHYSSIASPRPVKPITFNISVYEKNEPIPNSYTVIGKIHIGDTGFTVGCGYDDVIELAKQEARKVGGDGIQIISIKHPDFNSTCYRIKANVIALDVIDVSDSSLIKTGENEYVGELRDRLSPQKKDITELPPLSERPDLIAVVDFKGNNVSDGDCKALTDRLRTELFNTRYFKVIEREMMDEILKEQGLQQTGCTTNECMVEVGRLIGVEKIVGGSISKVGNVYSISSRIVNVETGEIENTGVYDHTGDIGELLMEGMRRVAFDLAR